MYLIYTKGTIAPSTAAAPTACTAATPGSKSGGLSRGWEWGPEGSGIGALTLSSAD